MKIGYTPDDDELVVHFSSTPEADAEEVRDGVFLLFDQNRRLIGLRVEQASRAADLGDFGIQAAPDPPESQAEPQNPPPAKVTIFSDGACIGNPGPGGWAARLKYPDGRVVEIGGADPDTTNNRMELNAAIQGLKKAGDIPAITIITDSEYLRKGITEWIHGWKRRGWITVGKKPVLNQDLWQNLDRLNGRHVTWRYTRGHAGDPDNERCDQLAQVFARGGTPALREG